jgi:drug/metabolite transporter (DMT)-like permease
MMLQKRNVSWLGRGRHRDGAFYRRVLGWTIGLAFVSVAPAFNYAALLALPANVVAATAGSNVAFTAFLSAIFLGERIGRRRLAWIGVLFGAIVVAGFRGSSAAMNGRLQPWAIFAALAVPSLVAVIALALRPSHGGRGLALLFAAVAGSFSGSMVLPMRAIQIAGGANLLTWLATPYPYLFLVGGSGGFVFEQLSYKDGEMSRSAPIFSGMQVLWPALVSHLAFAATIDPVQTAAFSTVAFCIAMIARERRAEAAA